MSALTAVIDPFTVRELPIITISSNVVVPPAESITRLPVLVSISLSSVAAI